MHQKSGCLLFTRYTENSTSHPEPLFASTKLLGREPHNILGFFLRWFSSFFFLPVFVKNFNICSFSESHPIFSLSMLKTHGVNSLLHYFHFFPFSSSNKLFNTFATFFLMWKLHQLFTSFFFPSFYFLFLGLSLFPLLFAEDTAMQMINKVIETLPSDLLKPGLQPARLLHLCSIIQAPFLPGLAEDAHCCHSLYPRLTLREPF